MEHDETTFDLLMGEVMADRSRFGHREHVHLTWLAIRRYGAEAALDLIDRGIRRTARYAGAPQKYHHTMSRAWVELIAYHVAETDLAGFDAFIAHHPALLDKRLLTRFYEPLTLAAPAARSGWVAPDRAPFPR